MKFLLKQVVAHQHEDGSQFDTATVSMEHYKCQRASYPSPSEAEQRTYLRANSVSPRLTIIILAYAVDLSVGSTIKSDCEVERLGMVSPSTNPIKGEGESVLSHGELPDP